MWLINARTRTLTHFVGDDQIGIIYAILSHTWAEGEVSFSDIHRPDVDQMTGYAKIAHACDQALKDDIEWVWVDTCCIDKQSSAELSEAINSMYRWYYNAHVCYALLSDCRLANDWLEDEPPSGEEWKRFDPSKVSLDGCRWFRRGWTLQELIAPKNVRFYDSDWTYMGQKSEVLDILSSITRIDRGVLADRDRLMRSSIAQRMSWASERRTTRLEDRAYSLLGLFDVNMPLLYGEGNKAFVRLQEEIVRNMGSGEKDLSILAWSSRTGSVLAPSPSAFTEANWMRTSSLTSDETCELTSKGLRVRVFARPDNGDLEVDTLKNKNKYDNLLIALNCTFDYQDVQSEWQIALRLQRRPKVHRLGLHPREAEEDARADVIYDKVQDASLTSVEASDLPRRFSLMDITISRTPYDWPTVSQNISIGDCSTARVSTEIPRLWGQAVLTLVEDHNLARGTVFFRSEELSEEWPDVTLVIALADRARPPRLYVHGYERNGSGNAEAVDVAKNLISEGEERVITSAGLNILRILACYVLKDGELMWNLQISRPDLRSNLPSIPPQIYQGMELYNHSSNVSSNLNSAPYMESGPMSRYKLRLPIEMPAAGDSGWLMSGFKETTGEQIYIAERAQDNRRTVSNGPLVFKKWRAVLRNLLRRRSAPARASVQELPARLEMFSDRPPSYGIHELPESQEQVAASIYALYGDHIFELDANPLSRNSALAIPRSNALTTTGPPENAPRAPISALTAIIGSQSGLALSSSASGSSNELNVGLPTHIMGLPPDSAPKTPVLDASQEIGHSSLVLKILQSLDSLADLFNASMTCRSIRHVYKANECHLLQRVLLQQQQQDLKGKRITDKWTELALQILKFDRGSDEETTLSLIPSTDLVRKNARHRAPSNSPRSRTSLHTSPPRSKISRVAVGADQIAGSKSLELASSIALPTVYQAAIPPSQSREENALYASSDISELSREIDKGQAERLSYQHSMADNDSVYSFVVGDDEPFMRKGRSARPRLRIITNFS